MDCRALAARAGLTLDVLDMPRPREAPGSAAIPEATLLGRIRRRALDHGYLVYHTWRSDKSAPGFPDLVLAKPGRLILAECKSATGKLTQAQHQWLAILRQSISGLEVYEWHPQQWPEIMDVLTRKEHP